jgi:hypothetical protein
MAKKTFFLFLALYMVYGAGQVYGQVRISADTAPHPSAVLDLNTGENTVAAGGLLLPRVRLNSTTHMPFGDYGSSQGMMIYNLNEGNNPDYPKEGVYFFNGTEWVLMIYTVGDSVLQPDPAISINFAYEDKKLLWMGNTYGDISQRFEVSVTTTPPVARTEDFGYLWTVSDVAGNVVVAKETEDTVMFLDGYEEGIRPGMVYDVFLTVTYRRAKAVTHIARIFCGAGAWLDSTHTQWLRVANANLDANQSLLLSEQLTQNYSGSVAEERVDYLGCLYQWGSAFHRSDRSFFALRIIPWLTGDDKINPANGQPNDGRMPDIFVAGNTSGEWRDYTGYKHGYLDGEFPAAWTWNANATNVETPDPCRETLGGAWRVPTQADWDKISANNDIKVIEHSGWNRRRGITVSPDSGRVSWFLPETRLFGVDGKHMDNNDNYPDANNLWFGYWLNDNAGLVNGNASARCLFNNSGMQKPVVGTCPQAWGLNIRCVADL